MKIPGISSLHLFTAENSKLPSPGSWRKPCDAWMPGWSAQQGPRCSARKVAWDVDHLMMKKYTPRIWIFLEKNHQTLWSFFYFIETFVWDFSVFWGCCYPIDGMIWSTWTGVHSPFCTILWPSGQVAKLVEGISNNRSNKQNWNLTISLEIWDTYHWEQLVLSDIKQKNGGATKHHGDRTNSSRWTSKIIWL